MRIAYLNPRNIGPYHRARFIELSRYIDLTVVGVPANEYLRPWKLEDVPFKFINLFNHKANTVSLYEKKKRLLECLDQLKPDAVVCVGYDSAMRTVGRWAKNDGLSSVLVMISWAGYGRRYWIKEQVKKHLVCSSFDYVFVPGSRSHDYALSLGFEAEQIWVGGNVIDNDYFFQAAHKAVLDEYCLRKELSLPDRYFVCVSRYHPEKNLVRLLKAFSAYRQLGGKWKFVLVGAGPQESQLRAMVVSSLRDSVILAGWKSYQELPIYYALAECFILPSLSESWGLVTNEAMACGLPALLSDRCGCVPELCHSGTNGFVFSPYDVNEMASLMLKMSSKEVNLEEMGRKSKEIISNYTLEIWAKTLLCCLQRARERKEL